MRRDKESGCDSNRPGSAVIEFPNDLDVVITREFDAPIGLVFDITTKPEHVRQTFAPFGEEVTVCSIDLRVGGGYHFVMVTDDGTECSFRGTFLEVEPPTRTAQTYPPAVAGGTALTLGNRRIRDSHRRHRPRHGQGR